MYLFCVIYLPFSHPAGTKKELEIYIQLVANVSYSRMCCYTVLKLPDKCHCH